MAMDLSPEAAMKTLERRFAVLQAEWRERAARLVAQVHERLPGLAQRFGASEVWLFGSLAWGEPFAESDVDLAIAGLTVADFDALAGHAYLAIDAPVDVVRLEDAPPSLRERIARSGVRVYPPAAP